MVNIKKKVLFTFGMRRQNNIVVKRTVTQRVSINGIYDIMPQQ